MAKKLYRQDATGIRFVSDRRPGEVRIPNYVYDIWLPLLGADVIGVYSMYCRLERQDTIKKITLDVIAKACRIGKATLYKVNEKLQDCGFITVTAPTGNKRAHHFTTEITIKDPPQFASTQIIEKYQSPAGYEPLSAWLVLESDEVPVSTSDVPSRTSRSSNQNDEEVPVRTSTMLQPSVLQPSSIESNTGEPSSHSQPSQSYFAAIAQGAFELTDLKGLSDSPRKRIGALVNVAKALICARVPDITDEQGAALVAKFCAAETFKPGIQGKDKFEIRFAAWLEKNAAHLRNYLASLAPKIITDNEPAEFVDPEEIKRVLAETSANMRKAFYTTDVKAVAS